MYSIYCQDKSREIDILKILVITSTFPVNEDDKVPTFVRDQIRALKARDNSLEISVLIPHNSYSTNPASLIEESTHDEIRYHYFWPTRFEKLTGRGILPALKENPLRYLLIPFFLFGQGRALEKQIRKNKPDVLYAHWFVPQALVAVRLSRKYKIPLLFTTHASDVSILSKIPFGKHLVSWGCDHSVGFTAVSERTSLKLTSFFDKETWENKYRHKLEVIPMGVSTEISRIDVSAVREILIKLGINTEKKMVLCLGRLVEKKGFKYAIAGFEKLPIETRANLQLIIAGDGYLLEDLRGQVAKANLVSDVIFTGYVNGRNKNALIESAHTVLIPSIIDSSGDSEGLPVVLMEALAFGKPIIATNVSGAEEILDPVECALIEQKSASAISEALIRYAQLGLREYEECSSSARGLAQQFEWAVIGAKHCQWIREAVSENTNGK